MYTFRHLVADGEGGYKAQRFGLYWEGGAELSEAADRTVAQGILGREDLMQDLAKGRRVCVFWLLKRSPNKARVEARLVEYQ